MNKAAKPIPRTVTEFVEACKTLNNDEIYFLFEDFISQELRDELYSFGRPYSVDRKLLEAGTHTSEPCRDAMYELGKKYNVQSLLDY